MKVSFVIPAFNEEALISRCLESVITEIERSGVMADIVVVNNASTDSTKNLALGFPRVRVVDEPKKGLTYARAAGMRATDGEIIANVDADVMIPAGWLTTVAEAFSKDSRLVAISGPFIYYDLSPFKRAAVRFFYMLGYVLHLFNHFVLRKGAMLQGGNFTIRRATFEKVGGFDTSIKFYGEDTDVACRLSTVGSVLWTWRLPVYASGRRLKKEGIITMGWKYTLNHLSVIFLKKPATTEYNDIRELV